MELKNVKREKDHILPGEPIECNHAYDSYSSTNPYCNGCSTKVEEGTANSISGINMYNENICIVNEGDICSENKDCDTYTTGTDYKSYEGSCKVRCCNENNPNSIECDSNGDNSICKAEYKSPTNDDKSCSTCKTNYEKVGNVCKKKKGVTCSSNSECKSNKCLGGSCCKDSMEDPNCKTCHS